MAHFRRRLDLFKCEKTSCHSGAGGGGKGATSRFVNDADPSVIAEGECICVTHVTSDVDWTIIWRERLDRGRPRRKKIGRVFVRACPVPVESKKHARIGASHPWNLRGLAAGCKVDNRGIESDEDGAPGETDDMIDTAH
ncbi:hypothetical protein AG1IA_06557 [Rhizoctonia solani AG-1 IA]|uniref:Uncharacterized protein n=1 Tax=Thanatephorus cucumeris (strain AG1-IA) TaxID=983506 RepID=L8WN79_THACA|nr:hypothetical protein AG1IA_06557 [Rhizoctonia solani AG-1 IA]